MSLDEFLAWEREQPDRHEFDGFTIVAMTGGSLDHSTIASNFDRALSAKLRGSRCRVFRGDAKVIANGSVRYPDVSVTCSRVSGRDDTVPEPVVIIEVVSPSTERVDRGRKRNATTSPLRRCGNTRLSRRTSGLLTSIPGPKPAGSMKSSPRREH